MNSYIKAVTCLDSDAVASAIDRKPAWLEWAEPSGRNALHYLCGVVTGGERRKVDASLKVLKMLLASGMDINAIHEIPDDRCVFPATPLWYAYTRGRNRALYEYLLKKGADPSNCWWAIAWYDDVEAGKLWLRYGADFDKKPNFLDQLFLGTFQWKKYKFAEWLLDQGADVNTPGPDGVTALMLAVKRKEEDVIKLLIARRGDPDRVDEQGISARILAETNGPKRLLQLLVPLRKKS